MAGLPTTVYCAACRCEHALGELHNPRLDPWPGLDGVYVVGECPAPVAPGKTRPTLCVEVEVAA